MEKVSEKPLYISVETECIGEDEDIAGHELDTLNALYQLGYRKFKLVDQRTLTVLDYNCFYKNNSEHNWFEQIETNCKYAEELIVLSDTDQRVKFTDFFPGSSGPFGEELAGKWYDYHQAKEMLKKHREDKMRLNEPGMDLLVRLACNVLTNIVTHKNNRTMKILQAITLSALLLLNISKVCSQEDKKTKDFFNSGWIYI